MQWLAKPGGHTLAEIAAGTVELSHDALDAVDRGKSTDDLRAALVHASVLDGRDETLALMKRWTADTLGALAPGRDPTTLRAFATWKVGRELAIRRARQPGPDAFATKMPKNWISAAVQLTSWLHAQHRELVDLDQPLLDAWLADGPADRARTVRPFVVWLERRERHDLRIPSDRGGTPVIALDDRQRLTALRTLLHDDEIDPRLRLAGCLVALYAQPASRVVRLTAADLQLADTGPQIRLGRNMIALPLQLRDVAQLTLASTTEGGWLFPGQKAGLPSIRRTSLGA